MVWTAPASAIAQGSGEGPDFASADVGDGPAPPESAGPIVVDTVVVTTVVLAEETPEPPPQDVRAANPIAKPTKAAIARWRLLPASP
jgi:hypothetical protein